MAVKIHKDREIVPVYRLTLLQKLFELGHLNEELAIRFDELSIEVSAGEASAIVSDDDTIRIGHW